MTLIRGRLPAADTIPHKATAAALLEYEQAMTEARDATREFEELVRGGDAARVEDRRATTLALASGEAVPPPVHQREHEARVEVAERVRAARRELAETAWAKFEALWSTHRAEMLAVVEKDEKRDRAEYEKAVDKLEVVATRRAARASLRAELGGEYVPGEQLVIRAEALPIQDAPGGGRGLYMLTHVVAALPQLGRPEPPRVTNPDKVRQRPLAEQGRGGRGAPSTGPAGRVPG